MKYYYNVLLPAVAALLMIFLSGCTEENPEMVDAVIFNNGKYEEITYPSAGQVFYAGGNMEVMWKKRTNNQSVIFVLHGEYEDYTSEEVENTGYCQLQMPDYVTPGEYQLNVKTVDGSKTIGFMKGKLYLYN